MLNNSESIFPPQIKQIIFFPKCDVSFSLTTITLVAAATSVMVVKEKLTSHLGKNIICLICGGNIDSELFNKVLIHAHP